MQQSCENSRCIGFGVVVYLHSIVPSSCAAIIVHHTVLSEGQNFESPSEHWCCNDNFVSCYASQQDIVVGLHIHGPMDRYISCTYI